MIDSPADLERTLTEIAISFIYLHKEQIDQRIEETLKQLVLSLGFDRATLVQLTGREKAPIATHCWAREGYPVRAGYNFAVEFPYCYSLMEKSGLPQFFHGLESIPATETKTRERLLEWGPRTMFCIPLNSQGRIIGWITIGTFSMQKLSGEIIDRLSLLGSIFVGVLLKKTQNITDHSRLLALNQELRNEIDTLHESGDLIGESRHMRLLLEKIDQIAPLDATVLLLGETGVGKDLVARRIHAKSPRRGMPFYAANCASLSPQLMEDELFGHEKGAFTGATARKKGRFEAADGSSLFLDEVGELPFASQAKLLRILQEQKFERLGSTKSVSVNVRIIAATNRDLEKEVEKGTFREDLFYRLNVFPIHISPLRERLEDLPLLVEAFVQEFSTKYGKRISRLRSGAIKSLQEYHWPGNVRELRNIVERAVILTKGPLLEISPPGHTPEKTFHPRTLVEVERDHILETLWHTGWRVSGLRGAARLLGMNPKTLESRMRKLGITRPPKSPPDEFFAKTHSDVN